MKYGVPKSDSSMDRLIRSSYLRLKAMSHGISSIQEIESNIRIRGLNQDKWNEIKNNLPPELVNIVTVSSANSDFDPTGTTAVLVIDTGSLTTFNRLSALEAIITAIAS